MPNSYTFADLIRDAQAQKRADDILCARNYIHWHISGGWRRCRDGLKYLLDPNYRHPKAKRHV